jgi:hypothetical protein
MAIGAGVVIGLGKFEHVFICSYKRLTIFVEAKFGMGKHVWTVPEENFTPYF